MDNSCVIVTSGNLFSMLMLSGWLPQHGHNIRKVYVTYRLPSSKSNVREVLRLLCRSGFAYTYYKIWMNRLGPLALRLHGLPYSLLPYIRWSGLTIPVEPVATINAEAVVSDIRRVAPDYLISINATEKFSETVVRAPTKASLNFHGSLLPAYAGLSPYFWQLYNGDPIFGTTFHQIIPALDAGPIIERRSEPLAGQRTCLDLQLRIAEWVSEMLCRFFDGETALEQARPQPSVGRSYYRHPTRAQVREFHRRGFRMMDRASRKRLWARVRDLAAAAREHA